jgi:hypothetical protein
MQEPTKQTGWLRRLWEGWKKIAHTIGNFQARVLLTIFYAVLVMPMGLVVRLFRDPLRIKHLPESWLNRDASTQDMDWARRQW